LDAGIKRRKSVEQRRSEGYKTPLLFHYITNVESELNIILT